MSELQKYLSIQEIERVYSKHIEIKFPQHIQLSEDNKRRLYANLICGSVLRLSKYIIEDSGLNLNMKIFDSSLIFGTTLMVLSELKCNFHSVFGFSWLNQGTSQYVLHCLVLILLVKRRYLPILDRLFVFNHFYFKENPGLDENKTMRDRLFLYNLNGRNVLCDIDNFEIEAETKAITKATIFYDTMKREFANMNSTISREGTWPRSAKFEDTVEVHNNSKKLAADVNSIGSDQICESLYIMLKTPLKQLFAE